MRKPLFVFVFIISGIKGLLAQDIEYAKTVIKELCSEKMFGRGDVNNGGFIAAEYIKKQYEDSKLLAFGTGYYQDYGFQINAFPASVSLKIDDRALVPGEEFIVDPDFPYLTGNFNLIFVDSSAIDNIAEFEALSKKNLHGTFLVVDGIKGKKFIRQENADKIFSNAVKARGLVYANQEKLTWGTASEWSKFPVLYIAKGSLFRHQLKINLTVESEIKIHNTQNVIGYIKGSQFPDSFVVFSAHYDHLGMMGRWAMFPGANDNASGVAMMLDIMHYYTKNKPKYSIAFMAFSGEEAGLFGSYYYTQHPLFDLRDISMLINLDLMGTGDKGMTVVNATLFPVEFQELQDLNFTKEYLPTVNPRGKAQNSDHYFFSENGVKAFYFYLMGEYHYYHDVYDMAEALTLSKYKEAFKLITDFTNEYCSKH